MVAGETATETVYLVAREQSKYWKSVDPKACEPREGTLFLGLEEFISRITWRLRRNYFLDTRQPHYFGTKSSLTLFKHRNTQGTSSTLSLHPTRHDANPSAHNGTRATFFHSDYVHVCSVLHPNCRWDSHGMPPSSDIFDNGTLVVFVHELWVRRSDDFPLQFVDNISGNLRLELQSSAICNVEMERSYLVRLQWNPAELSWRTSAAWFFETARRMGKAKGLFTFGCQPVPQACCDFHGTWFIVHNYMSPRTQRF